MSDSLDVSVVEVIQADREAAVNFAWAEGDVGTMQLRYDIQHGKHDDHHAVQAFARHRIAATRTPSAETTRVLVEALEPFVRHGLAVGAFGGDNHPYQMLTDTGYRNIPADDFENARAALSLYRSGEQ